VLKISPKLYALVLGIKIYPCASSASPALNQLQLSAHTPASLPSLPHNNVLVCSNCPPLPFFPCSFHSQHHPTPNFHPS
jgi:hypothetical protein